MAVVPQKNIQGKIILYISFLVYPVQAKKGAGPIQESVNDITEGLETDT